MVFYHTVRTYERAGLLAALERALLPWGGWEGLLAGKQSVLLKPNFVAPETREGCSCTRADFYLAVAESLRATGREVTIADSPAFGSAQLVVRLQGALGECRRLGVKVRTLRRSMPCPGVPGAGPYQTLTIARELTEYDAVINLPKLKVHQQMVFTGATKNLFGCVVGKRKPIRHFHSHNDVQMFARMILATAAASRTVLHLADGIVSMHRHGPRGGQPYPLHALIVGDDYLEVDWLYAARIGLPPLEAPIFQVLDDATRARLAAACAQALAQAGFAVATSHVMARQSPIEFTALHLVRSAYRSLRATVQAPT